MTKPWLKKNLEEGKNEVNVMGATIKLKTLSFGDSRKATSAAMEVNERTGSVKIDAGLLGLLRTLYQIDDWDLTDEDGNKLPISLETFDEVLDEPFVNELIAAVSKSGNQPITEDEKK
ncbi:hypothetical protein EG878_14555 [Enterococcus faecalis]|nr:hypothetical protein EG878_14555 [Enterococcus faecalis]